MSPLVTMFLTVCLASAGIVLAGAWLVARYMTGRRSPDPIHLPDELGLPYEAVRFAARDGLMLSGRVVPAPENQRTGLTVIFCAGLFGSMDGDTAMLPPFINAGFDVLQFDWRAHGESEGDRVSFGLSEVDDLLGAVDFARSRGAGSIALMGFSMGGAVALRAAALDERVAGVVCDGGFVHIRHALEGAFAERLGVPLRPFIALVMFFARLRLGRSLDDASPLAVVGRISPRPVLFIHGGADVHVPPADQDAVFAACGEPKSLWRVDRAAHRDAHKLHPAEYFARVTAFFAGLG